MPLRCCSCRYRNPSLMVTSPNRLPTNRQGAKPDIGKKRERGPERRARRVLLTNNLRFRHEQRQHAQSDERHAEADDKNGVEPVVHAREEEECRQRPEHGATGVHGAVHAEGSSQLLRGSAQRDQGVSGRGAYALPRPIEHDHARQGGPDTTRENERGLAQCRQAVPRNRHRLVSIPPVRDHASRDADERCDPMVEAVDEAKLQRRQMQVEHQVGRQHAADHLR